MEENKYLDEVVKSLDEIQFNILPNMTHNDCLDVCVGI